MQSSQQSMQAFLPHSLKEYQGLLLLRSVLCEIPYEGVLVDSEFDFTVNLDEDGSVLDLIDGSVDSAGGDNLVSPLEAVAELLKRHHRHPEAARLLQERRPAAM